MRGGGVSFSHLPLGQNINAKNVLRLLRRAAGKKTNGTHRVEEKFFKGLFLTGGSDGGIIEKPKRLRNSLVFLSCFGRARTPPSGSPVKNAKRP